MADENPHDNGKLRTFSRVLAQLAEGRLEDRLTRAMIDLIGDIQNAAIEGNAKAKGSITLKLDFTKDARMMKIVPSVKVEKPKEPAMEADQLYVTPDNNLTLNDQRQPKLPLRDITGENRETRAV
jgi:hypothetical protein